MPNGAYLGPSEVILDGLLLVLNEAHLGPNGVIPNRFLLVLDGTYLNHDGVILNGLYICLGRPKDLECRKDTWREASYTNHFRIINFNINMYLWIDKTSKKKMEKCMKIANFEKDKGVSFKQPKGHLNIPSIPTSKRFFCCFLLQYSLYSKFRIFFGKI